MKNVSTITKLILLFVAVFMSIFLLSFAMGEPVGTDDIFGFVTITKDGADFCSNAQIDSNVIAQLDKNETYPLFGAPIKANNYTWYNIRVGELAGYVNGDSLNVTDRNNKMILYPAEKIDWYTGGINELWVHESNYQVYDVKTGIAWVAHRWAGGLHVDAEPLTAEDTAKLCECYGVTASSEIKEITHWQRRPCLVTIGDRTFACSLYGVPHNLDGDTISNNNYDGQLCIFFSNSKTHGSKQVDSLHEEAIEYAWQNSPSGNNLTETFSDYYLDENGSPVESLNGKGYHVYEWYHIMIDENGAETYKDHYATIANPSVCLFCHATNIKAHYLVDENGHYYSDDGSAEAANYQFNHKSNCVNPSRCIDCGLTEVNISWTQHAYSDVYESNQYSHWLRCTICNEIVDRDLHCATCEEPNKCMICGMEGIYGEYVEHSIDYSTDEYIIREDGHYKLCTKCGREVFFAEHLASCKDPYKCYICGSTGVEIKFVLHDQRMTMNDNSYHWDVCADCGEEIPYTRVKHSAKCDSPDTCYICGATGVIASIEHHYSSKYEYDNLKHWRECELCHQRLYGTHYAKCSDLTKCTICNADSVDLSVRVDHNSIMISATLDGHVYQCDRCGEEEYYPHYLGSCRSEYCAECRLFIGDQNAINDHVSFELTGEKERNGHWMQCTECGYKYLAAHTALCSSPNSCLTCGANSSDYDYVIQHGPFRQDGTGYSCSICGSEHNHIFYCFNCGICSECGINVSEIDGAIISHAYDPVYLKNCNGHYQVCRACGTVSELEPHDYVHGMCKICWYESAIPEELFAWTVNNNQVSITGFYGKASQLVIPDIINSFPVTSIGSQAFMANEKLKTITIPATVTSIGTYAFRDCTSLKSISLPEQLTTISNYAFYGCSSLKEIYLPPSVSDIANHAFMDSGLEAVTCYTASYAHQWAATKNYRLTLIPLYTDAESMILPRGLRIIEEEAFSGISARRIVVPDGCTEIRKKAFSFCADLEVLELPASIKSIDDTMMYGSEGVMILAPKGSYALKWAEKNHFQVIGK